MKILNILIILNILLLNSGFSQVNNKNISSLTGNIIDKKTKKTLPFVSVKFMNSQLGGLSDADGNFIILNIPGGKYDIEISSIGYTTLKLNAVEIKNNFSNNLGVVSLIENSITLNEVTVSPGSFSIMNTLTSKQSLSSKDIKNMSWAEDITRAVSRLPGVSANDFSSKFSVRGGESDEILMTIDGMELYDPFHQRDIGGGLFSIVDIETIEGIDLLTGGFSAEFGNRQSAVFNMKTKKIAENQKHSSVGLSVMNARLYTDGKFAKNKGSYLFSARRGMLDVTYKAFHSSENIPYYSDMLAKIEYEINPKHRLSFHMLRADDKTKRSDIYQGNYDSTDIKYANTYNWLTLNSALNKKLFARTIIYNGFNTEKRNGSYNKDEYGDVGVFFLKDRRKFNFLGIKQDWNFDFTSKIILKAGIDLKQLNVNYDYFYTLNDIRINNNDSLIYYKGLVDVNSDHSGKQANFYLTSRFQMLPSLFMETGLRYDYTSYTNDKLWSPRVSLAYAFSRNTFLRAAWGYYYQSQFIQNLDVNHNATTFNKAELSKHYVIGFEHLFKNNLSFRMETYYKNIPNINPIYQNLRDPLEVFPEARNDVAKLNINHRIAKGIEFFLKYDTGKKTSWWFSYALALAEDNIKNIEFDGLLTETTGNVPRTTNQLHTIYADFNYRPSGKWHFSLSQQIYSGWHRTNYHYNTRVMPDSRLLFYPVHEKYNATKNPTYHRMDLRVNRHFEINNGNLSAFFHIINIYNQKNLRKFDLNATHLITEELIPDGKGGYITPRGDKFWFGITPVFGFSWEF